MSCGEKLKMINRLDCVSFPLIFTHDGTKVGNRPDTAESGLATLREVRICQNMTNFVRIPRSYRENMSMQVPYILKFSGDLMLLKIIHSL